jgi:PII-like signaling protein
VKSEARGKLLRIVVGGPHTIGRKPRYQAIVSLLHEEGVAGATVLRGIDGFPRPTRTSPQVIEVADRAERIDAVMPKLAPLLASSVVTIKDVDLIAYRSG